MKKVCCVMMVIGFVLIGALQVEAETYTLRVLPNIAWAEYRVAEAKGFWEKQGVTVKLVEYAVPAEAMRAGIQRRFDLTTMPIPVIATYRDAGVFDAAYLGTFSIPAQGKSLILKKDLINKSLKDHTIGMFNADLGNKFFLSTYLKTVNTSMADVQIVQMKAEDLKANFIHNRLDAILTIVEQDNLLYEQADGVIASSTEDIYEPHGLALLKQGGVAAIPLEDLKKILRGCVEAIEWMRDPANWEEYKAILQQRVLTDKPDLSDDQLQAFTKMEKFVDPQTLLEHNQQKLRDYFTQFHAFLVAEGLLKADVLKDFTYENVVKNQALIEVLQEFVK
jgi:NitT/TauT family transport system substrate-binding protein